MTSQAGGSSYSQLTLEELRRRPHAPIASLPAPNARLLPFSDLDPRAFELLVAELIARDTVTYRTAHFYGRTGQAQHGLDVVATRRDNNRNELFEVKRIAGFTPADLSTAVRRYTDAAREPSGVRRFDPQQFVVVAAAEFESDTANVNRLEELKREFEGELLIDCWGAETLTRKLGQHPDLVGAFFGQHWAEVITGQMPPPADHLSIFPPQLRNEIDGLAVSSSADWSYIRQYLGSESSSAIARSLGRLADSDRYTWRDSLTAPSLEFLGVLSEFHLEMKAAAYFYDRAASLVADNGRLMARHAHAAFKADLATAAETAVGFEHARNAGAPALVIDCMALCVAGESADQIEFAKGFVPGGIALQHVDAILVHRHCIGWLANDGQIDASIHFAKAALAVAADAELERVLASLISYRANHERNAPERLRMLEHAVEMADDAYQSLRAWSSPFVADALAEAVRASIAAGRHHEAESLLTGDLSSVEFSDPQVRLLHLIVVGSLPAGSSDPNGDLEEGLVALTDNPCSDDELIELARGLADLVGETNETVLVHLNMTLAARGVVDQTLLESLDEGTTRSRIQAVAALHGGNTDESIQQLRLLADQDVGSSFMLVQAYADAGQFENAAAALRSGYRRHRSEALLLSGCSLLGYAGQDALALEVLGTAPDSERHTAELRELETRLALAGGSLYLALSALNKLRQLRELTAHELWQLLELQLRLGENEDASRLVSEVPDPQTEDEAFTFLNAVALPGSSVNEDVVLALLERYPESQRMLPFVSMNIDALIPHPQQHERLQALHAQFTERIGDDSPHHVITVAFDPENPAGLMSSFEDSLTEIFGDSTNRPSDRAIDDLVEIGYVSIALAVEIRHGRLVDRLIGRQHRLSWKPSRSRLASREAASSTSALDRAVVVDLAFLALLARSPMLETLVRSHLVALSVPSEDRSRSRRELAEPPTNNWLSFPSSGPMTFGGLDGPELERTEETRTRFATLLDIVDVAEPLNNLSAELNALVDPRLPSNWFTPIWAAMRDRLPLLTGDAGLAIEAKRHGVEVFDLLDLLADLASRGHIDSDQLDACTTVLYEMGFTSLDISPGFLLDQPMVDGDGLRAMATQFKEPSTWHEIDHALQTLVDIVKPSSGLIWGACTTLLWFASDGLSKRLTFTGPQSETDGFTRMQALGDLYALLHFQRTPTTGQTAEALHSFLEACNTDDETDDLLLAVAKSMYLTFSAGQSDPVQSVAEAFSGVDQPARDRIAAILTNFSQN